MTNTTINKIILSATTAMFLTACGGGGGGSTELSAKDKAMAVIKSYADDGTKTAPTVKNYTDAGVTGVTAANLAAMNALVDDKVGADVDTLAELNTIAGEVDTEAPVIKLTGSSTVDLVVGATYTEAGATVTDNKDTALTATIAGAVDTATAATYTVTYNVTDAAGNAATEVTRTVNVTVATVADTEAPVITLTGSSTVDLVVGDTYTDAGATVTDNKDTGLTVTVIGATIDTSAAGTYEITYNVTDAAGNIADEKTRTVTVTDAVRFEANDTNVTDLTTKLVWDKTASETCTAPKSVPTVEQFQSIIDYTKGSKVQVAPVAVVDGFTLAEDDTHYKTSDNWDIRLKYGIVTQTTTATKTICVDANNYVAPVAVTFTPGTDDSNVTASNGLVWSDQYFSDFNYDPQSFTVANDKCVEIGMRLPTLIELDTIYDRTENNITSGFTKVYTSNYWTSTVAVADDTQNWTIDFTNGKIAGSLHDGTHKAYARCVK